MWRGKLSWRRLGVLIKHLPMESATKTALRNAAPESELRKAVDGDYGSFSQTHMMLAEMIDTLNWLKWAKTEDGADNKNQPEPYPRPGVKRRGVGSTATPAGSADVISLLERIRANRGGIDGYIVADEAPSK